MTESPGPSARLVHPKDDVVVLGWWPAKGTPLEAEWSRATLDVVRRVWRAEGASLYWRQGTEALRDDLADWLAAEAMEFRTIYRPDDVGQRGDDDELATWCRVLYRVLCVKARWHFTRVMRVGLSAEETRGLVYTSTSLDRPVDGRNLTCGRSSGEALSGSLRGIWGRPAAYGDPLDLLLVAEDLSERVAALEDVTPGEHPRGRAPPLSYEEAVRRLDALAPDPGAGSSRASSPALRVATAR